MLFNYNERKDYNLFNVGTFRFKGVRFKFQIVKANTQTPLKRDHDPRSD